MLAYSLLALLAGPIEFPESSATLVIPAVQTGAPAAGRRVVVTPRRYAGTRVRHTLYLPADWSPADDGPKRWPVIVELTGNRFPQAGSTGEVEDAGLGYGLTGGRFIWVVLPYVSEDGESNAVTWWGDVDATVAYAKRTIPEICERFAGDANRVFLCGFSRGAIGVNFIGLHDDEIARLWAGLITHDHYDGERVWPRTDWGRPLEAYRHAAAARLRRVNGRPVLICQNRSTESIREYLEPRMSLTAVTFLDVDVDRIFGVIPNKWAIHPHTDRWLVKPSRERDAVWRWLRSAAE